MSESNNKPGDKPEIGLIPDEDLPEDLQPKENPLARNPEEEGDAEEDAGDESGPKAERMPGVGDPGAVG